MVDTPPPKRSSIHHRSLTLRRVRFGLIFLACFVVVSTVGYRLLSERPWLESLHWVIITVSSVGYGETSAAPPAIQAFSIVVILVGMLAVAATLGLFLQLLVQGEIRRAVGARRMTRDIKKLTDHIIICGFGRIGRILAEDFDARGIPFTVIETNSEMATEAENASYLVVVGDATDEDVLLSAGIERAKTIVVALDSDANCVFLTLTARNLNSEIQIISRGEQPSTEKKLRQAGANRVVMPAMIGARRIANLVTQPVTSDLLEHVADRSRLDANLEEVVISQGSVVAGQTVRASNPRQRYGILVVALRNVDGKMQFNPNPDTVIEAGDTAIVMGRATDLEKFRAASTTTGTSGV